MSLRLRQLRLSFPSRALRYLLPYCRKYDPPQRRPLVIPIPDGLFFPSPRLNWACSHEDRLPLFNLAIGKGRFLDLCFVENKNASWLDLPGASRVVKIFLISPRLKDLERAASGKPWTPPGDDQPSRLASFQQQSKGVKR